LVDKNRHHHHLSGTERNYVICE